MIINPDKIIDGKVDFNDKDTYQFKESGIVCPHLRWDNRKFKCAIHQYDWYKETPCYEFTQIEDKNSDCRIGRHAIDTIGISHFKKIWSDNINKAV